MNVGIDLIEIDRIENRISEIEKRDARFVWRTSLSSLS